MTRWCVATHFDGTSQVVKAIDKTEAKRVLVQLGYQINDIMRYEFFDQPEPVDCSTQ